MIDEETVGVYDAKVGEYTDLVRKEKPEPALLSFLDRLPAGGSILDLGCGPGHHSAVMRDRGFTVDAVDASSEMVRQANEVFNVNARKAVFDDLDSVETYDAVWASFSLLHAPQARFADHIAAIHRALKKSGWFCIALKLGEGEQRDKLGRRYSYFSQSELEEHLTKAGFTIQKVSFGDSPGLSGEVAPWIAIVCQR